jgi:hypothetical protein
MWVSETCPLLGQAARAYPCLFRGVEENGGQRQVLERMEEEDSPGWREARFSSGLMGTSSAAERNWITSVQRNWNVHSSERTAWCICSLGGGLA